MDAYALLHTLYGQFTTWDQDVKGLEIKDIQTKYKSLFRLEKVGGSRLSGQTHRRQTEIPLGLH